MAEDTKTGADDFVAYRNRNTDTIHLFDAENAELEARGNFERVELSAVPRATIDEARRERANRESIARAGERRSAAVGVELTVDTSGEIGGVTASVPATKRTGAGHPTGVLSRPGVDDVQIGPDPEKHPKTIAELEAQAELDSREPQNVGVLIKQHEAGDAASEMVPGTAAEVAAELAPGTEVAEVEVKAAEDTKPKRSARTRTGTGRTATATDTEGDTAK